MFHPMFYILQKYFSQFLVVFNITSEDEGTLWYFSEIYLTVFTNWLQKLWSGNTYYSAYFSHFVKAGYMYCYTQIIINSQTWATWDGHQDQLGLLSTGNIL